MRAAASPSGHRRKKDPGLRRAWCCSFGVAPQSPDPHYHPRAAGADASTQSQNGRQCQNVVKNKHFSGSVHSSPSPTARIGRGLIDPRRILSPGRVSPIDSDAGNTPLGPLPEAAVPVTADVVAVESETEDSMDRKEAAVVAPGRFSSASSAAAAEARVGGKERGLDLRLALRGRDGRSLVLEVDSEVLCRNSLYFARMVLDSREKVSNAPLECRKIEVSNIADLAVFRDTIELMFEEDVVKWLVKAGVSRAIDVLEVSSTITFERAIMSCLKYLEAVPWTEGEEEKLKSLIARCILDETIIQDVLSRLYMQKSVQPESLALQLVQSVANGTIASARKEMQTLVNGLFSKSSVYQKDPAGLNEDGLYDISCSCIDLLVELFEEASGSVERCQKHAPAMSKPLIERISHQVDNLTWLLEILIDKQMAEDFVNLWANQGELVRMHEITSPMVRYELSRVSACIFMALGKGRIQCGGDVRHRVLTSWFVPILADFGWLQRCSKGLDMRMLEEGLGQALLTLSLKQQENFFVEWFKSFARRGTECPNLSRAFQVWWRRSFVRPNEVRSQLPRDYRNLLYEDEVL